MSWCFFFFFFLVGVSEWQWMEFGGFCSRAFQSAVRTLRWLQNARVSWADWVLGVVVGGFARGTVVSVPLKSLLI